MANKILSLNEGIYEAEMYLVLATVPRLSMIVYR